VLDKGEVCLIFIIEKISCENFRRLSNSGQPSIGITSPPPDVKKVWVLTDFFDNIRLE